MVADYTERMPNSSTRDAAAATPGVAPPRTVQALSGLLPFLRPYRGRIALALLFLVLAAATTLVFPLALRSLIDRGLLGEAGPGAGAGERLLALRGHFAALFGVGVALAVFSAARFYSVSWLGERVTADLRSAVYRMWCGRARSSSRPPRPARCCRG